METYNNLHRSPQHSNKAFSFNKECFKTITNSTNILTNKLS